MKLIYFLRKAVHQKYQKEWSLFQFKRNFFFFLFGLHYFACHWKAKIAFCFWKEKYFFCFCFFSFTCGSSSRYTLYQIRATTFWLRSEKVNWSTMTKLLQLLFSWTNVENLTNFYCQTYESCSDRSGCWSGAIQWE